MARRSTHNALDLWMNGERVGSWETGPRAHHQLSYGRAWQESARGRPLSLSLKFPPGGEPLGGPAVKAWFDNLLPDNDQILERVQQRYGAPSTAAFDLLLEIGRDCVGAIQLLPKGAAPPDAKHFKGRELDAGAIESLLAAVPLPGRLRGGDDFRISLAGAQEKTALTRRNGKWYEPHGSTPTTHIFKLPLGVVGAGVDPSTSLENEWLCSRLLSALGFDVADCEVQRFGKQRALVVTRFDRQLADDGKWIVRLPQEDCCQATGTPPAQKYEEHGGPGIRALMNLLRGSDRAAADRADFFRRQIAFFLLGATDGHAKNFSVFLGPQGSYHLTPCYDVISAYPVVGHGAGLIHERKLKLAMAVWGKNRHYHWREIKRAHYLKTAHECGLSGAGALIDGLLERVGDAIDEVKKQLHPSFPTQVSKPIFNGLKDAAKRLSA
ncbi:MAG: type II toxin-antitoxin system HipA family toxin [Myxococcaceae bacterium]